MSNPFQINLNIQAALTQGNEADALRWLRHPRCSLAERHISREAPLLVCALEQCQEAVLAELWRHLPVETTSNHPLFDGALHAALSAGRVAPVIALLHRGARWGHSQHPYEVALKHPQDQAIALLQALVHEGRAGQSAAYHPLVSVVTDISWLSSYAERHPEQPQLLHHLTAAGWDPRALDEEGQPALLHLVRSKRIAPLMSWWRELVHLGCAWETPEYTGAPLSVRQKALLTHPDWQPLFQALSDKRVLETSLEGAAPARIRARL